MSEPEPDQYKWGKGWKVIFRCDRVCIGASPMEHA
jgi:hypothetical protein